MQLNKERFFYEFSLITLGALILTAADLNITTGDCIRKYPNKKNKIISIVFFHQFIALFASFGWLAQSKIILSIFVLLNIIIPIHWFLNRNKCFITQSMNKMCNIEDRWFPDLFYFVGFKKFDLWNDKLWYLYSFIVGIIGLIKLVM